jgi:hypothetical protein
MTNNLICDIVINTNEVVDIFKIVDPIKPSDVISQKMLKIYPVKVVINNC